MAMVGAVLTNTLVMLVPSFMRLVAVAQAVRMENWSPCLTCWDVEMVRRFIKE
jgi:hypothetical protein